MKGLKWKFSAKLGVVLTSLLVIFVISLANTDVARAFDFALTATATNDAGGQAYCRYLLVNENNVERWTSYTYNGSPAIGYNTGNDAVAIQAFECQHQADDVRVNNLEYVEMVVRVKTSAVHQTSQYYQTTNYYETTLSGPRWVGNGDFRGIYMEQIGVEENYGERYEYWRLVSRLTLSSGSGWVGYIQAPFRVYNNSFQSPMSALVMSWTIWQPSNAFTTDDREFLRQLFAQNSNAQIVQQLNNNGAKIDETNDLLEQQQQQDQQDRDNLESQQSDSQDSADDSSAEAEQTGTTLLTAFTSFIGALTSASPSNCKIDMDMGNMDLGEVDYCKMSPPPIFQSIASIMMIAFCVPLSIATATKVINLFRSFQS